MLIWLIITYTLFSGLIWASLPSHLLILQFLMFLVMAKFTWGSKNFLTLLLCLEMLTLILLLTLILFISWHLASPALIFMFLVLAVCEASLGLSLLVRLGRFSGNELLLS